MKPFLSWPLLLSAGGSGARWSAVRAAVGAILWVALLSPGFAHAEDWQWSFTAQPGSLPAPGLVTGRLLNLPTGTNVSGAGSTVVVESTPGGVVVNQAFTFTIGTFSSTAAGVTFASARYDAVIGGVSYAVFLGSNPPGGTFFPQLSGGGGSVNLLNVNSGTAFVAAPPPPTVVSIVRVNPSPTNAASVQFAVTFSAPVTGVDPADFVLTSTGLVGSSVAGVSGSGATYSVTVNAGAGAGSLRLDVVDDDSIVAGLLNPLGGAGAGNGSFSAGQSYAIDTIAPTVTIDQAAGQSDPTGVAPVTFTVAFSEPVTGFTATDITLGGTAGATTVSVTGSGATYSVAVSGMARNGTVTASIGAGVAADAVGNPNQASVSTDNTVQFTGVLTQAIGIPSTSPLGLLLLALSLLVVAALQRPRGVAP